jgi:hypothetical protein
MKNPPELRRPSMPRIVIAVAAVAMTALTNAVLVALPAHFEAAVRLTAMKLDSDGGSRAAAPSMRDRTHGTS